MGRCLSTPPYGGGGGGGECVGRRTNAFFIPRQEFVKGVNG